MDRRDTARRVAGAIGRLAQEQSGRSQSFAQGVVKKVKPDLLVELADSEIILSEEDGDIALSQWLDAYNQKTKLKAGDTLLLSQQPGQSWYVAFDVLSNTSVSKIFAGDKDSTLTISKRTNSYVLTKNDGGKFIEINASKATSVTVPANAKVPLPVGTQIHVAQVGSGQTTLEAASGVTLNGQPGLKIKAQWGRATLIKRAKNSWIAVGDLKA